MNNSAGIRVNEWDYDNILNDLMGENLDRYINDTSFYKYKGEEVVDIYVRSEWSGEIYDTIKDYGYEAEWL